MSDVSSENGPTTAMDTSPRKYPSAASRRHSKVPSVTTTSQFTPPPPDGSDSLPSLTGPAPSSPLPLRLPPLEVTPQISRRAVHSLPFDTPPPPKGVTTLGDVPLSAARTKTKLPTGTGTRLPTMRQGSNTSMTGGASGASVRVRHASLHKKGLVAVATRPWKSVKRRFIRSDEGVMPDETPIGTHIATNNHNHTSSSSSRLVRTEDETTNIHESSPRILPDQSRGAGSSNIGPEHLHWMESDSRLVIGTNDSRIVPSRATHHDNTHGRTDDQQTMVTAVAEQYLRQMALIATALWMGAVWYQHVDLFTKLLEYAGVAWLTSLTLSLAVRRRRRQAAAAAATAAAAVRQVGSSDPLSRSAIDNGKLVRWQSLQQRTGRNDNHFVDALTSLDENKSTIRKDIAIDEDFEIGLSNLLEKRRDNIRQNSVQPISSPDEAVFPPRPLPFIQELSLRANKTHHCATHQQSTVHPALNPFYVIDVATRQRVLPNEMQRPFQLDTEYFQGCMLVLIRSPDVDDPLATKGTSESEAAVSYFRGKQRRFEFQFQVQLKRIPTGRVYFACELQETIKIGLIQRAFTSAAMAFVKATNSNFHCSLSGMPETDDGRWEAPHMAFPVEEGMNRVVVTPPGEQAPMLGTEIYESEDSIKQRKKGIPMAWNMEDTYTFSLWSAYVDFLEWRCLNLPGIRPFNLANVIGREPIMLTLYELQQDENERDTDQGKHHFRCNTHNIVRLEMCNSLKSAAGPWALNWIAESSTPLLDEDDKIVESAAEAYEDELDVESVDESHESFDEQQECNYPDEGSRTLLSETFAEELGEGIYVRSGDVITLRSANTDYSGIPNNNPCSRHVSNGGGFAILQEHHAGVLVIQKTVMVGRRKEARSSSKLIRSGDTVTFKLLGNGPQDDSEPRYLTIHRGWWLKWVSVFPKKNGHFTVHTNDTDFVERRRSDETQSSYLTFGGSFWLRHKRWSRYSVGITKDASVTYGGYMLGLHIPGANPGEYFSDDGQLVELPGKDKAEWMRPLQLQAYEYITTKQAIPASTPAEGGSIGEKHSGEEIVVSFSKENHNVDVPAFVELINRVDRIRQHAYVVRVRHFDDSVPYISNDASFPKEGAFVRLRTGRDLAHVMRAGLKWRNNQTMPSLRKMSLVENVSLVRGNSAQAPPIIAVPVAGDTANSMAQSSDSVGEVYDAARGDDAESTDGEWDVESMDEIESNISQEEVVDEETSPIPRGKRRMLIGKIAHSVKTTTSATTKRVVSRSVQSTVNVGKATVNAGKAILPIRLKKPPMKEPKLNKRVQSRTSGLREAVNSRSMRRAVQMESQFDDSFLAGELSAPEQSRRSVSSMLAKMSSQPESSEIANKFSALLRPLILTKSDLDCGFLQGGAVQVGVSSAKFDEKNGVILFEALVARCLWECHWREEWCGLYAAGLRFYAPFTGVPCLEVTYLDIKAVRFLEPILHSPLAGYPLIVIETSWICHYCAFADTRMRQTFYEKIKDCREQAYQAEDTSSAPSHQRELAEARFWQGFQTAIQYSHGGGKWADIASGMKLKSRVVLNNRRMRFDLVLHDHEINGNEFAQELLSSALSFSLESLKQNPEALIQFLDSTSHLQTIDLNDVDRNSPRGFCFFANVYHCLLQHALLFSIHGPLHKASFNHFMRTSCYEIGGDVFSLAELYSCVLRGNMSRPTTSRPPYVDAPKKSNAFRYYALQYTSTGVNFVLNVADRACPREVPVLNHFDLDMVLDTYVSSFIRKRVVVNFAKKQVILPKVFDVYRNDFCVSAHNGYGHDSVKFCLRFLDEAVSKQVRTLLDDPASIVIKFHQTSDQFYSSLKRN